MKFQVLIDGNNDTQFDQRNAALGYLYLTLSAIFEDHLLDGVEDELTQEANESLSDLNTTGQCTFQGVSYEIVAGE